MARSNTGSNSNYFSTTPPITGYPFSFSGWVYPDSFAATQYLWRFDRVASANHLFVVQINTSGAALFISNQASTAITITGGTTTLSAWNHILVRAPSAADVTIYVNGDSGVNSATNRTPVSIDRGRYGITASGTAAPLNGRIAEFGFWNADIGSGSLTDLYTNKYCPALVSKANLVAYLKFLGNDSPEPDSIGSFDATMTGTMAQAAHPSPIYYETLSIAATDAAKPEGTP